MAHFVETATEFGADDPSFAVRETAVAYHAAITSKSTFEELPGVGHLFDRDPLGAEALLASIREAQGSP